YPRIALYVNTGGSPYHRHSAAAATTTTGSCATAAPTNRRGPHTTPSPCPGAPASAAVITGIARYASTPNHQSHVSTHSPRTAALTPGITATATASPAAATVERTIVRPAYSA